MTDITLTSKQGQGHKNGRNGWHSESSTKPNTKFHTNEFYGVKKKKKKKKSRTDMTTHTHTANLTHGRATTTTRRANTQTNKP